MYFGFSCGVVLLVMGLLITNTYFCFINDVYMMFGLLLRYIMCIHRAQVHYKSKTYGFTFHFVPDNVLYLCD